MQSSKRPSKLIFVVLDFMIVTSPGTWHCTSDDVIDRRARSRSQSSLLLSRDLDKQHEIEEYNIISVADDIS